MKLQDILHGLLVLALVGVAVEPHLIGLVSIGVQHVVEIVLLALQVFVYYADVIFVKGQDVPVPTPPTV